MFDEDIDSLTYGVMMNSDENSSEEADEGIDVPITDISENDLQILTRTVNPLNNCSDFGVQLYKDTAETIFNLMAQ